MAAVTAAIATTAIAAYGANNARKNANRAQDNAERAAQDQAALDRERLDFSKQQYGDWQARFNPVWDKLSSMSMQEEKPDYGAITADVGSAFDTSRDIQTRNMQRMGIRPTDGAQQAADTQYALGRAGSLVDTRNRARTNARDQYFARITQLANIANGGQANASNLVSAAYSGASGGAGQRAGMYNANAANYGAQAGAGWSDVGAGLGFIGSQFGGGGGGGGGSMPGYGPSYGYPGNPGSGSWGMTNWG